MSPIQGLTDQSEGFFKLGQIRKGEKVEVTRDGKTFMKPVDLDYFRVTFLPGKTMEALENAFRASYGMRPTEINVRFAYPEASKVWDANYECHKQGGLLAKGYTDESGFHWIFYRSPETSEVLIRYGTPVNSEGRDFFDKPYSLDMPVYYNSKNEPQYMETVGRLQVVIRELSGIDVGYFEFRPESPKDIGNIDREIKAYAALAGQYGKSITGMPFKLIRREEEVTKKIGGKLTRGKSWVCHLTAGGDWGQKAMEAIERLALPDTTIIEAEYEDMEDFGSPEPEPLVTTSRPNALLPASFMTYEQACKVEIITRDGKAKTMDTLTPEQLLRVSQSSTAEARQIEAANVLLDQLQHKV